MELLGTAISLNLSKKLLTAKQKIPNIMETASKIIKNFMCIVFLVSLEQYRTQKQCRAKSNWCYARKEIPAFS
jgi:hypothetical protein